jgi:Family of unknown function (DUF5678)
MADEKREASVPDFSMYGENRRHFPPPEELLKLAGEWVAFSADGTRVLAHGKDFEEVKAAMEAAGLNPFDAVWDQLPPLDVDSML